MSDLQFRLIYHTKKSAPLPGQTSSQSRHSGPEKGRPKEKERSRGFDRAETPYQSSTQTEHSHTVHGQENARTNDPDSVIKLSGTLFYRAPGQGHLFVKYFAWFGSTDAATDGQIKAFLSSQDEESAHRIAAWCSQKGQGLLCLAKKPGEPIRAILPLAYAMQLVQDDMLAFSFKIDDTKHAFEALDAAQCKAWYSAIFEAIKTTRALKQHIERIERPGRPLRRSSEAFMHSGTNILPQFPVYKQAEVQSVLKNNEEGEPASERHAADLTRALGLSKVINDSSEAVDHVETAETGLMVHSQTTHVPASSEEQPALRLPSVGIVHPTELDSTSHFTASSHQQPTQVDSVKGLTQGPTETLWRKCVRCGVSQRNRVFASFSVCTHESRTCADCYSRLVEASLMSDGPDGIECPDNDCERRLDANEAWQQFIPSGERDDDPWHIPRPAGEIHETPKYSDDSEQKEAVGAQDGESPEMLSTSPRLLDAVEKAEQINKGQQNDMRETHEILSQTASRPAELDTSMDATQAQPEPIIFDEEDVQSANYMSSADQLSFITAEDQEEFYDLFIEQVGSARGDMSTRLVRDMLSQYSLQDEAVAKICLLCDTQTRKQLSFSEFALAMYYGMRASRGKPLPRILPGRLWEEVNRQNGKRVSRPVADPNQQNSEPSEAPLSRVSSATEAVSQMHPNENVTRQLGSFDRLPSPQLQHTKGMETRRKPLPMTAEPMKLLSTKSGSATERIQSQSGWHVEARQSVASDANVSNVALKDGTSSSPSGSAHANQSWDSIRGQLSSTSSIDLPLEQLKLSRPSSDMLPTSLTPALYRAFSDTPPPPSTFTARALSSQDLVTTRLNSYFFDGITPREHYTDVEIQEVSALLRQINPRWSRVPRTYVVLRTINSLDILDNCINVGFSDYWFPVTERSLPDFVRPSIRAAFVDAQRLILTKSMDIEKGEQGRHCYFQKGDSLPFEMRGILGSGGYGQVDKVLSLISFKEYARKRVLRSSAFRGRKKEGIKQFITEIEILKRLKHRHVVEFVGSYTDAKYIGLIMTPIAEGDLSSYMARATPAEHSELRTFFGCLAAELEFLHVNNVRHKDIKPSNILVSKGQVLFADFGLSFDFTDATGSTTMSMVNGMTPRYCAPEVANQEARNTMSDIWCLGVVFLEMIVTLKGETTQDMDNFFRQHGSRQTFIRLNSSALPEFITYLTSLPQWTDNRALEWTVPMLQEVQVLRPTASALVTQITLPIREGEQTGFCGICCFIPEEEDFSDYLSD